MVDQSDLPFRLLCRKYGCPVAVTPMIHSRLLVESPEYRKKFLPRALACHDRPLIAQLCGSGHTPQFVLLAAQMLQDTGLVDGIDLNCGCPQGIARRGKYGAFLLEEPEALVDLVTLLSAQLQIPVSVKVRLLPVKTTLAATTITEAINPTDDDDEHDYDDVDREAQDMTTDSDAPKVDLDASMALYRRLVHDAGIHMLTVHGRTRHHKGHHVGPCHMGAIQQVVQEFGKFIPIVANGSIASRQDALECLQFTGCDAVMSSEAILEYPALFETPRLGDSVAPRRSRLQLAREYLQLCEQYPPQIGGQGSGIKCIRMHLHRILHADLHVHVAIRDALCVAKSLAALQATLDALQEIHTRHHHDVSTVELSWYYRHRQPQNDENLTSNVPSQRDRESAIKKMELAEDTADCFACLFEGAVADIDEYDY